MTVPRGGTRGRDTTFGEPFADSPATDQDSSTGATSTGLSGLKRVYGDGKKCHLTIVRC